MKIILSRKGLDGGFEGAKPSPILPCGRLLSLPIPVTKKQKREMGEQGIPYDDLKFDGRSIREIIDPLHNYRFDYDEAHLDPDLDRDRYVREHGWRPVFGQIGNAQSHLAKQCVGKGALFLFYGRFQRTKNRETPLCYIQSQQNLHVIFGWLHVGETINVERDKIPDWLKYHPHIVNRNIRVNNRNIYTNNRIYVAAEHLTLDGFSTRGAGTFPCFNSSLQLTDQSGPMSRWCLPKWFYPCVQPRRKALSYHGCCDRWMLHNNHVILKTTSPGQEFVFDTKDYPEAIEWLKGLFKDCC